MYILPAVLQNRIIIFQLFRVELQELEAVYSIDVANSNMKKGAIFAF